MLLHLLTTTARVRSNAVIGSNAAPRNAPVREEYLYGTRAGLRLRRSRPESAPSRETPRGRSGQLAAISNAVAPRGRLNHSQGPACMKAPRPRPKWRVGLAPALRRRSRCGREWSVPRARSRWRVHRLPRCGAAARHGQLHTPPSPARLSTSDRRQPS